MASIGVGQNGHPDHINSQQCCRIAKADLLENLPCRKLQLKEINDPKLLFITDSELFEPPSCKAMEGVAAMFTSESFTSDSINFIAPAPDAETTVVFPT